MDNIYDVENMSEEEAEAKARSLGWRPKDEFNGDEDKFTDAKTFLDKANTNIPMLRENARKIEQRNHRLEEQVKSMEEKLSALVKRADEADKAGYERAIREIEARQRKAALDGDVDEYDNLQRQKENLNVRTPAPQPEPKNQPLSTSEQIAIQVFEANNPWYRKDEELNADMNGFLLGIKSKYPEMPLSEVIERAKERTIKANPEKFSTNKANSVLSSSGSGGRISYASIPAADKANFDRELEKNIRDLEIRGVSKEKIEQFKKEYQKNCLEMYK